MPSPSDPQYGTFQSTVSVMGSNLYATLLQSKKDEYKDITGNEVGRVKSTVSSMCHLIEKIWRETNEKKKQSIWDDAEASRIELALYVKGYKKYK